MWEGYWKFRPMRVSSLWCANISNSGPSEVRQVLDCVTTGSNCHGCHTTILLHSMSVKKHAKRMRYNSHDLTLWLTRFNVMASNRTNSLKLKWSWGSCSNYSPGSRGFKFTTFLNALTTVWCTETDSMWWNNGPYSAPRTQPLTEMSTRNVSWRVKAAGA